MYQATSKREIFIFCFNQIILQLDMNRLSYTFCQGPYLLATSGLPRPSATAALQ